MIWTIDQIDDAFRAAFAEAGPIDEHAVASAPSYPSRSAPQRHVGVRRYYFYLLADQRVTLCCIGMPLSEWQESAMMLVGTRECLGEFAHNKAFVGQKVLGLTMKPLTWLTGEADQHYANGLQALEAISFQILDLAKIEQSQRRIRQAYHWKKP